jgi:hypothetical protein
MVEAGPIEDENYASMIEVASKFVKFIEKEGVKAWHFLECLGFDAALKCEKPILDLLLVHDIASAAALVKCEEPMMVKCAPKLK